MSYHPWKSMKVGDEGDDITHLQRLLAGANRHRYDADPGEITGVFSEATGTAVRRMKFHLGYRTRDLSPLGGQRLRSFLVDKDSPAFAELPAEYQAKMRARGGKTFQTGDGYPLAERGTLNGRPYQGSHNHPNPSDDLHNWESCNAVDLNTPIGTTVLAVADGTIGSQIGSLHTKEATLEGLRLHLFGRDNQWYYAHLSQISVTAGQRVSKGEQLGKSGSASGVAHLHLAQKHGDPGVLIGSPTSGYVDHHFPG
ncbi:MAG: peptidoglycan DD-metalloendopeptidase family protein [Actinoallomurus sp.]